MNTKELETTIQTYFDYLNAKNHQITDLFTDDAVLMCGPYQTVIGMDAVKPFYENIFTNVTFGRVLHIDEAFAAGELGFVRTHSTGTVTPKATGEGHEELARELFVLQHINGAWRIRQYLFNHPQA